MTNSKYVPKRRFKEFELYDEWNLLKLDEVAKYRNGKAHENSISLQGKFIVVNSKFISTNGEVKKFTDLQIEPIFKNEISFVLSDVPNGRAIARTFLIDQNDKYTLNQRIAAITPNRNISPYYLYVLLNRNKYFLEFDDGVKQTNLSKGDVLEFKEYYPISKEQFMIGDFFQTIDSLITLHQHKLDKLKNLKKSYLSELFPEEGERVPKRRFPGFEGEWEEKKLKDVSEIYDGTHQTPRYTTDGIMFLSVENIKTLKSNKYISKDDFIKDFKIFPQNGDVLMTRIGDIGTSNVVNTDDKLAFYVSLALIRSAQLDSNFLNTSISSVNFQKELWSRTLHIAFPKKINKNEIGEVSILFPSISEQKQIGSFFQNLDKSVTLQQQKLDKLKDLKKAYLNELFV
ncbi:restriction endonuclease subunit S [Streptococcus mitis]|uniref:restriction endonuclease subunit S n=1 Tax=Streptococcus mitis TaxID=28037 RepID=UPI0039C05856